MGAEGLKLSTAQSIEQAFTMGSADIQDVEKVGQDSFSRMAIAAIRSQSINDFMLPYDMPLAVRDVAVDSVQFLRVAAELVLFLY